MISTLIGVSLVFIFIGMLINERNAKYLLAGYNTMSTEDQKKFNIKGYLPYFKKFHFFLGASLIIFGLIVHYVINPIYTGVFLSIYPLCAYLYFLWTSNKTFGSSIHKWNKIGLVIMGATIILVIALFYVGFKENNLLMTPQTIEIQGMYGEDIPISDISRIELVEQLPSIKSKTNGFAVGAIKKGYFQTAEGEEITLILNSDQKPYLLLTKTSGKKIYYTAKEKTSKDILDKINITLDEKVN